MDGLWEVLLDPRVLVTFIVCVILGALILWIVNLASNRKYAHALEEQRRQQESAVTRILDSVAKTKDELIADYEAQLQKREQQIAALEKDNKRLKDRVAQGGLLGMFGGGQREVISALLLENEQLHELLAQKQGQLRDVIQDMSEKLVNRLDEQLQESAHAIRYKQVLLSGFLQQEEARRLLDRFIAEGRLSPQESPRLAPVTEGETRLLSEQREASQEKEAEGPGSDDVESPNGATA